MKVRKTRYQYMNRTLPNVLLTTLLAVFACCEEVILKKIIAFHVALVYRGKDIYEEEVLQVGDLEDWVKL